MYRTLIAPVNVQFEITGACTHLCKHCYNFWREQSGVKYQHPHLSVDNSRIIIDKLAEAQVFRVTITGGEPMMNYDVLIETARQARLRGMSVGLNSNLILLNEKRVLELKEVGINHILTSILGPSSLVHDEIAQAKGSFNLLIEKMKVAKIGGIEVTTNMVVSKLNLDYVYQTAKMLHELGLTKFIATKVGCPGNCSDFSEFRLSQVEMEKYLFDLSRIHNELGMVVDILEPIPYCALTKVPNFELFAKRHCTAGVSTFTVSYDGTVRPCSHVDVQLGNILNESITDVWSRMSSWRNGDYVPVRCKTCQALQLCGAGCRMEGKTFNGCLSDEDPYIDYSSVPSIIKLLQQRQKQNSDDVQRFMIKPIKLRLEEFGAVICLGSNVTCIDHNGLSVISQLEPKVIYDLSSSDSKINWAGIDPQGFVRGLIFRGFATRV